MTGISRGATVPLQQVWELSQHWYADRMDAAFRGFTPEQAAETFRRVGLTSDFWRP